MILLDTHTWVWWTAEPKKLSPRAADRIEQARRDFSIGVSVISCWEVAMLVARERLGLSLEVGEWIDKALRLPEVKLLELTPRVAVLSTRLEGVPPKDPADRILIATAKVHEAPVITKDHLLIEYPHIETVW